MAVYRAQIVIPMFTNLPTDVVTNTLHFWSPTPEALSDIGDLVTPLIVQFYNAMYASASGGMGSYMNPGGSQVHWYDLAQPPPRVPYTLPLPLTITQASSNLPTEVSCVLSFQGDPVPGESQARRRGRIYLGGLFHGWISASAAGAFPTISGAKALAVADAAEAFHDSLVPLSVRWVVWSPTNGTFAIVTNGWVDNSPDTQRRRSVDATLRTTWVAAP
jgi:hypothetical protein